MEKEGGRARECRHTIGQDSFQKYIALLQNYFIQGTPVNTHCFANHHKLELESYKTCKSLSSMFLQTELCELWCWVWSLRPKPCLRIQSVPQNFCPVRYLVEEIRTLWPSDLVTLSSHLNLYVEFNFLVSEQTVLGSPRHSAITEFWLRPSFLIINCKN